MNKKRPHKRLRKKLGGCAPMHTAVDHEYRLRRLEGLTLTLAVVLLARKLVKRAEESDA